MPDTSGIFYLVSTPIGNLGDLSPRAQEVLLAVDYILCEEIAWTRKLGIPTPLFRYEGKGFKGKEQGLRVVNDLRQGTSVALVTNAGTPLISDPGQSLVESVVLAGLPVVHIPGPVAFVSAVVTSGLPTKNILFIGFLPKKVSRLRSSLESARQALNAPGEPASLVCYVSKYQLLRAVECIKEIFGQNARVSLAREMTKLHEEHFSGTVLELQNWLNGSAVRLHGEHTLVVSTLQVQMYHQGVIPVLLPATVAA